MFRPSKRIALFAFVANNSIFRLARIVSFFIATYLLLYSTASAQQRFERAAERPSLRTDREREPTDEDEIETDRDSFTPSTNVVGLGRLVLESSYSFIDNLRVYDTHSLPEIIARYGIGKNFELRFGFNYEVGGAGSPVSGNVPDDFEEDTKLEEESRVSYGTKIWLSEQEDWLPQSSFILQGYTPTKGEVSATTFSTNYVFGWKFRNATVWDSALKYSSGTFEEDNFNVWSSSTVFKVPLGEKWKAHAEYFGVYTDGREKESTQHFFSPGIHYLISRDLEVGVRVGWGLNDQSPNFFSNVGVGLRF